MTQSNSFQTGASHPTHTKNPSNHSHTMQQHGASHEFKNVSSVEPCPICGKPDYCSISTDGQIICCRRYTGHPGGESRIDKNGEEFWYYDFRDKSRVANNFNNTAKVINLNNYKNQQKKMGSADPIKPLPSDIVNNVYTYILSRLTLNDKHREALLNRGLTEESIAQASYRSWPEKPWEVASAAIKKFSEETCSRVPGFYVHQSRKTGRSFWNIAGQPGLLIPIRSLSGDIIALKYRADNPGENINGKPLNKYRYVSNKQSLISSGTPIHVPLHNRESNSSKESSINYSTIRITEGELKADIATQFTDILTISIPGVQSWNNIISVINEIKPENIILAFDADCSVNLNVATALHELSNFILSQNIDLSIESWDAKITKDDKENWIVDPKGIDDALARDISSIRLIQNDNGEAINYVDYVLSQAKKNDPPEHEKKLKLVKERLKNIDEILLDNESLNDNEILDALLTVYEQDKSFWAVTVKKSLKKHGIIREVEEILKKFKQQKIVLQNKNHHVNGDKVCDPNNGSDPNNVFYLSKNESGESTNSQQKQQNNLNQITISEIFPDAPSSSSAIIPPGWFYDESKILWEHPPGRGWPERVTSTPCVIDYRYQDVFSGVISLSIRWLQNSRWRKTIETRSTIANTRKIIDLSDYGLDVQSSTANLLSKYLCHYESINMQNIPCKLATKQMAWQGKKSDKGFMQGDIYKSSNDNDIPIIFNPEDEGERQIAWGLHESGNLDDWKNAVSIAQNYPRVLIFLYASFASVLLKIFGAPNFIMDSSGVTSQGKTVMLRCAASVWGNPDETADNPFLFTWDSTRVWIERAAAVLNNLPLILDDTKRCKNTKMIGQILYDFASGHGRGRGSLHGTQTSRNWKSILLSTGEQKITSFSEDGGTRGRTICIWNPLGPFGRISAENAKMVNKLNIEVRKNYGVAGSKFVDFLIENQNKWDEFKAQYHRQQQYYLDKSGDNAVAARMSDFFAVIDTAAILLHAKGSVELPWNYRDPIETLWNDLIGEATESDRAEVALGHVMSIIDSNESNFLERHEYSGQSPKVPVGGWWGKWDVSDWEKIAVYPHKLRNLIESGGWDSESVLRIWADRGWIETGSEKTNLTKQISVAGKRKRMILIKRQAYELINGINENNVSDEI